MVVFVGSVYYGGDTDDTITGTSSNDTLYGGGGNDVISGGDGGDYLVGEGGADVIDGGAGDDTLSGGRTPIGFAYDQGADKLTGGAGADTFMIEFGYSDVAGNLDQIDHIIDFSAAEGDRLNLFSRAFDGKMAWSGAIADPTFSLDLGKAFGGDAPAGYVSLFTWKGPSATYLIADVDGDRKLSAKDFVLAFDNQATLTAADLIQHGDVYHFGGAGADVWSGTAGADIYYGREGADTVNGLGGGDTIYGGDGGDTIDGGDGDDLIVGGDGGDVIHGGAGADKLYANNNLTSIENQTGVDYLYGDAGDDSLVGTISSFGSASGSATLDGGDGADILSGGLADTLLGGAGDDILGGGLIQNGGAGDDRLGVDSIYSGGGNAAQMITGGAGADTFVVWPSSNYSYTPRWSIYATVTDFNTAEGDRIAFSYRGGSYSTGQGYPMVLRGAVDAGFSLTDGKAFSSTDYGAGFIQVWTWTTGGDTFLILDADSDGKLSNQDFILKFKGMTGLSLSDFTADSVGVTYGFTAIGKLGGTSGADILTGTTAPETYYGLDGDDQLHGGDGDDYLYGGQGADQIWGDEGNDYLYGGAGDDTMRGGDGADRIEGGAGADVIYGGAGADRIDVAGSGATDREATDTVNLVYGEDGDDTISGGFSLKDQLHGGDGRDSLYGSGELWGDAGDDTVTSSGGGTLHGGEGDDYLSSVSWTGNGVTTMYGDAGKDNFGGGAGDDVIYAELGDGGANGGGGADVINIADLRAGETVKLTTVTGDSGRDTFVITNTLSAELTLYGATAWSGDYDDDLLDLSAAAGVTRVNLGLTTAQDIGMGRLVLMGIESVRGGDHGAVLTGDTNANRLIGGAAADTLSGGAGEDLLTGGGGDDALDGGDGLDVAAYSGASGDYSWTQGADGAWTVKDLRAKAADGVDTLKNIESLKFSDKTVALTYSLPTAVATAFTAILRAPVGGEAQFAFGVDLASKLAGGYTTSAAITEVIRAAGASTSVATLAYEFFTGKIPGQPGIDYLVSPTGPNANNLNSAYYQSFNLENRYINFAVNLGKLGEGKDAFLAKYGSLNFVEATREVYKTIFGAAPTDAKIHAMIDTRVDYFAAYGGDGVNGIGTKAAMVGWLLAEAQKADLGVMVRSNDAWLADLADGSAPFAIDILDPAKGYYKADFIFGGS